MSGLTNLVGNVNVENVSRLVLRNVKSTMPAASSALPPAMPSLRNASNLTILQNASVVVASPMPAKLQAVTVADNCMFVIDQPSVDVEITVLLQLEGTLRLEADALRVT